MPNTGKFGITRGDDGSLANLLEWPWYWRYPAALLGIIASIVGAMIWVNAHPGGWKFAAFIAGGGILGSLCAVPEVLVLGFLAGLLAGFVWIATTVLYAIFPGLETSGEWRWWAAGFAIVYLYSEKKAMQRRIDALERSNRELLDRLN